MLCVEALPALGPVCLYPNSHIVFTRQFSSAARANTCADYSVGFAAARGKRKRRENKMKMKEKRFATRQQRLFIAFLVLVIVASGLLLWLSQKHRSARDLCITKGYDRTVTELADCMLSTLKLRAIIESGVSPEDLMATLEAPPYAAQTSQSPQRNANNSANPITGD